MHMHFNELLYFVRTTCSIKLDLKCILVTFLYFPLKSVESLVNHEFLENDITSSRIGN
jgi:hypothetical protein